MAVAAATPELIRSRGLPMRTWRVMAIGGFAFLVAHLGFGLGGPGLDRFSDRWLYDGLEVLAAVGCLLRAASTRVERGAWGILGLGVLSFALGDICFDHVYGGNPPDVSICDAFYLAFYPACYVSLALLVKSRISSFNRSVWLDGVIAALAAASVSAATLLQVVLDNTHGKESLVIVSLAYPVADLVLLALVILVFGLTARRPGRAWATAGLAFGLITAADSIFLYLNARGGYAEGTLLDALWPAALLLLAVAAWQPAQRERRVELEGRFLAATPLACGVLALGVLVEGRFHDHNLAADALAAAAVLMVFVRTALSFVDNARLLEQARALSLTDALTGLANRRSLTLALERALDEESPDPMVFVIFDLNGFKRFNDTFGHPSGDALLVRLGTRLQRAAGAGEAFRLGGDEFCVLVPWSPDGLTAVVEAGVDALSERGDDFDIEAVHGAVLLPEEATDATDALRLADERLYAQKYRYYQSQAAPAAPVRTAVASRRQYRDSTPGVAPSGQAVAGGVGEPALGEPALPSIS
jgi:two-component system, cell cycle response regulator